MAAISCGVAHHAADIDATKAAAPQDAALRDGCKTSLAPWTSSAGSSWTDTSTTTGTALLADLLSSDGCGLSGSEDSTAQYIGNDAENEVEQEPFKCLLHKASPKKTSTPFGCAFHTSGRQRGRDHWALFEQYGAFGAPSGYWTCVQRRPEPPKPTIPARRRSPARCQDTDSDADDEDSAREGPQRSGATPGGVELPATAGSAAHHARMKASIAARRKMGAAAAPRKARWERRSVSLATAAFATRLPSSDCLVKAALAQ